ncbi:hypothetical protein PR048_015592 [Dryococelus australis]|uniref:Uncharacterized protein n=1 Tax=Dryococelus australis TaxID=614101 RepID=A0ABQ9HHC3_9NEOP|nr:hypothetical protein PR048_015592 [Dryococelus australis]
MLQEHNPKIVGTLRKNKLHIPPQLCDVKKRDQKTSMFGFDNELTCFHAFLRRERMSMCKDADLPEIIDYYNSTKDGVDLYDQRHKQKSRLKQKKTEMATVCVLRYAKWSLSEWLHHLSPQPDINRLNITEMRCVFVGIRRATNDSMDGNTASNPNTPNRYRKWPLERDRNGIVATTLREPSARRFLRHRSGHAATGETAIGEAAVCSGQWRSLKLIKKREGIKDSFLKSEKKVTNSGQPAGSTRQYLYARQLEFLKTATSAPTETRN